MAAGDDVEPVDARVEVSASRARSPRMVAAVAVVVALLVAATIAVLWDGDGADGATNPRDASDEVLPSPPSSSSVPADPLVVPGSIVFAADAGAGAALMDPIDLQRIETVPEDMDIYVTRPGEPTRRLLATEAHERCPAFSPDGERLAYLATPGMSPTGSYAITGPPLDASLVILRLDRATDPGDAELVVHFPAAIGYGVTRAVGYACPQWSPDGSRLAFLAHPTGTEGSSRNVAELRVVALDGRAQVVNPGAPADESSSFAWSPAGDSIAYVRDDGVWAATLDGRPASLLWPSDQAPTAVSWSARGELAVTVPTDMPVEGGGTRPGPAVDIVEVDAGTATLVETLWGWSSGAVSWTRDGSRLALLQEDGQIAVRDRADSSTVQVPPPVVDGKQVRFADVAWVPDGEQLLVLAYAENWADNPMSWVQSRGMALLALSTDGAEVEVLTPWTWAFDWTNLHDVSWLPTSATT